MPNGAYPAVAGKNRRILLWQAHKKKPQDVSFTHYGGRPKAGACEFFVLL